METMPISVFKAKCLRTMARVRKTGKPLLVTRFGKPLVEIRPAAPEPAKRGLLGSLPGSVIIRGDIVSPSTEESDWSALSE